MTRGRGGRERRESRRHRDRPPKVRHIDEARRSRKHRLGWLETMALVIVSTIFIGLFATSFSATPAAQRLRQQNGPATLNGLNSRDRSIVVDSQPAISGEDKFACSDPIIVDGDTLRCGRLRIRLASIDAPEMPGHCRAGRQCVPGDPYASAANLERLIARTSIVCRQTDTDHYGRIVALCTAGERDLSCEQVRYGFAVERYGRLMCPTAR